jgi:hypothetical protein
MSGRIFSTVITLFGVGLRYVIKGVDKSVPADTPPAALAKSRPAIRHGADVERGVLAETAPIVCTVLIAMALGVASGLWINTGLASPAFDSPPASTQLSVHAIEQTVPALASPIRSQPDDSNVMSKVAAEAEPDEPSPAGEKITDPGKTAGVKRADTTTPNEGTTAKTVGRTSVAEARLTGGRVPGRVGPCTLSASASSLTIRSSGGSATITLSLNGTAGPVRVTPATPNWSDVAVFAASQTSGNDVEVRWYTIRSVSKRAGVYRVSFITSCGTKTIPVTVTQ